MIRRRLALYTLLYIAGITAGFFMFERSRELEAACFSAAVIAVVCFSDPYVQVYKIRRYLNEEGYTERHLNTGKEMIEKQKTILAMMFLAGFILFSFRTLEYSTALAALPDKDHIKGRVISVSVKDDKVRFIIRNRKKGPSKVLLSLDQQAAARSAEKAGLRTAKAFVRSGAYGYIGEMIEAGGEYSEIPSADDPGCFDYNLYMKSKGVTVKFNAYIIEVIDAGISPDTRVRRFLYSARESFIGRFDNDMQGFIRGVIFGDKSDIDEDIIDEFNDNSTGHILAVSGLHVGFLYGLLRLLTAHKRTLPVSILIIAVIMLYGEMTMWSPATVRACIVMTVSLFSAHLRRCSDLLTSVSLAAFLILTFQPYQLFTSGFQLSFLALSGIAFFTGPISSVTGEAIGVMLAVQLGTLPVLAYSYCRINPLSLLINVPVIMLVSILVPLCIVLLMIEAAAGKVPALGIDLAELISYAVIKINQLLRFDGGFSIKTAGPGAAAIIVIYLIFFGLSSEWTRVMLLRKEAKRVLKQGILLLMPLAMLFSCLYDTISDDEIVFAAVGQGDCVHIRTEGHDVLIDGGGQVSYESRSGKEKNSSAGYNVGKNILMPYLMHSGADNVEIALVTHLHADHYKGIEELSEIFPVGAIVIPADYKSSSGSDERIYADDFSESSSDGQNTKPESKVYSSQICYIGPKTKIDVSDDVSIDVIWPLEVSDEPIAADDPNEHNTVYMIHYKGIKIMVTGDLLEKDELDMVDCYEGTDTLRCDILKVAHHGSKSSSSEAFLDAAKPSIAVIQCGRNNFYGHPHRQTLERLKARGIRIFRTDLSGAVGIDIHGKKFSVDLYKQESSES
ncbi:MAG: DNA internalization-related competence protein ComEC/Rec2 [Mogibacterium sp.]|nr:DNA internalization-related competence protein ComEC/Rec2 [Mogibacterium sp.]MBR0341608.1 DNA internalization-related competence protein ComEC/Rec2 [Oscillospiraceae bacterium]